MRVHFGLSSALAFGLLSASAAAQLAPALPGRQFASPSGIAVAAADFTGDGNGDVVLVAPGAAGTYLHAGDGLGGLAPYIFKLGGLNASDAIAVDLNGDAALDLVSISPSNGAVTVHLGGPTGLGFPTFTAVGVGLSSPSAADLDHDGDQDVVVESLGGLQVLLGSGLGTIAIGDFYGAVLVDDLALGEFSGDSHVDIAVATGTSIVIWTGTGTGAFAATAPQATGFTPTSIEAADFNVDGIQDLLAYDLAARKAWTFVRADALLLPAIPITTDLPADTLELDTADFSGDGLVDLAANSLHGLALLGGTGTGAFGSPADFHAPTSGAYLATVSGDLDGDGTFDLVKQASATLSVFLGGGPQGLRAAVSLDASFPTSAMAAADMDGDGDPDVVHARSSPNLVQVLEGDGHGAASPGAQVATTLTTEQLLTGDLNGDGRVDFLANHAGLVDGQAASYLADGVGGFSAGPTLLLTLAGAYPNASLADLTGEGTLDFVGNSAYFAGSGAGAFGAPSALGGNQGNFPGDLDNDGDLDVVGIQAPIFFNPGAIVTGLNDGSGTFSPAANSSLGVGPSWLALADFDDDGDLDVFQNGPASGGARIYLGLGTGFLGTPTLIPGFVNTTSTRPIARDFDRDGNLDVATGWGDLARGDGLGAFPVVEHHAGALSGDFTTISMDAADWDGDGREDLLLSNAASGGTLLYRDQVPCAGTATPYGSGCAGSGGFVPLLDFLGCPEPAAEVVVRVQQGVGPALALIAVGSGQGQLPLGNGCDLLVFPLYPGLTPLPLTAPYGLGPGTGTGFITATLAPDSPPGSLYTLQAFVIDLGAPGFFAGSNAVEVVIL